MTLVPECQPVTSPEAIQEGVSQLDAPPSELTARGQWVAWRWEERGGKLTKPPVNLRTGNHASSTDPSTWGGYDEALRFCQEHRSAAGVGFVFAKDDPYAGIDLDGCRDPKSGEIAPWAQSIITYFDSYTEVSPSGTGVKIFIKGEVPAGLHKGRVEIYDSGRYFTVTRLQLVGTPLMLGDRSVELILLYAWLRGGRAEDRTGHIALRPGGLEDREIIEKARLAGNGAQFAQLWQGGQSGYPSQSEADLALCSHLSFWTGGDANQIDRLFRQSGLYRAKWDEPHFADGRTYGAATIGKAINGHGPRPAARFARTDSGNSELFASLYRDRLRYDHRRKRWLLWAGHRWEPDADAAVVRLAKEAARLRYQEAAGIEELREREAEARWAISSESRMRLEATLNLAKAEHPLADTGEEWDADPWLLGVVNGVLNLRTGKLRDGRPEDRINMRCSVEFDPDANCPRWERFLNEIFGPEEDLVDYIRRASGYSLSGDTSEQCHFICWGEGWNGKSTFQRVQREVLGDYSANTPFSTLEMTNRYAIPNDLAALYARRLVTASELNEAVRLNEARLKMLAGEDPVTARFLHGEFFTFMPVAKFWLSVNHKPIVNDDSTGFWRKVRLIPFTQSFEGRAEKNLKAALKAEYPGILAWMVRGCLEWQKRGLSPPGTVKAATEQYRAESDPVAAFLTERCLIDSTFTVRAGALYKAYQEWCDEAGLKERERLTSVKFGRIMGGRFHKREQRSGNFYEGVGLKVGGPTVEGCVSDNPPHPSFSRTEEPSRDNQKNPPQPSTLSDNPPHNPPSTLHDRPLCSSCGAAMSGVRVSDICGRCQR